MAVDRTDVAWLSAPRVAGESLLDADAGLAACLAPEELARLRPVLRVRVEHAAPGSWTPPAAGDSDRALGLLVLDGALYREIEIAGRRGAEVVGPGDLLRPSGQAARSDAGSSAWQALLPTRVAVVDERATALIGRFPRLTVELLDRGVGRARGLAAQFALSQVTGVDVRIERLLEHVAERWGRVTPEGIVVPLPLTHQMLGRLVGASRQSVTTALGEHGRVVRRADRGWLLVQR